MNTSCVLTAYSGCRSEVLRLFNLSGNRFAAHQEEMGSNLPECNFKKKVKDHQNHPRQEFFHMFIVIPAVLLLKVCAAS